MGSVAKRFAGEFSQASSCRILLLTGLRSLIFIIWFIARSSLAGLRRKLYDSGLFGDEGKFGAFIGDMKTLCCCESRRQGDTGF